jgi:hypothetical protein
MSIEEQISQRKPLLQTEWFVSSQRICYGTHSLFRSSKG